MHRSCGIFTRGNEAVDFLPNCVHFSLLLRFLLCKSKLVAPKAQRQQLQGVEHQGKNTLRLTVNTHRWQMSLAVSYTFSENYSFLVFVYLYACCSEFELLWVCFSSGCLGINQCVSCAKERIYNCFKPQCWKITHVLCFFDVNVLFLSHFTSGEMWISTSFIWQPQLLWFTTLIIFTSTSYNT